MTEICLITGNHPRHKYFATKLILTGKVSSWVIEEREEFLPQTPTNIGEDLKSLFRLHFNERERVEMEVFGTSVNAESDISIPFFKVSHEELNSDNTIQFVRQASPKLVISYGCHKLNENFLKAVGTRFWNTHGGLSPEYRGVTTHFWPSYFLEPQMTGMTLHETTNFLDAGSIIFQTAAPMVRGDTLHRLAARNVEVFTKELSEKIKFLNFSSLPKGLKQVGYGKVFMGKDWRPEHLRFIYETHADAIVDKVIDGVIEGRYPKLISVLG